ncbi:D-alanine--D-alanine ligase [uncultured Flavobacterium sp.]|uniref:D-alanine--D-alanine ligase n=1 Tax=uncultured Flavobacterium sp. TaxID=165435 RepID=UPI0030EB2C19|tara:strand:+ start:2659 stop:3648 length:990 start_codon:yes stop_codon:yes gene_type:complete
MNIAVVMGGYSDESVISLRSGQLILNNLDKEKYNIYEIHILLEGWFAIVDGEKLSINKADFSFSDGFSITHFDVILNTVHGTPGEDGHLQAYWELLEIPYAGCNYYQSSLTFNKRDTLSVLSKFNIPRAKSIYVSEGNIDFTYEDVVADLGLPFFVKPNQSGSSLGISKVNSKEEYEKALIFAFAEDKDILIESFLDGTEISVGVLNYKGKTTVLGLTEIVSHNDFFDYEAKYLGKSEEITPARISPEMTEKVTKTAIKVYESLRMKGFSRAEYIIMNDEPHFIEINTNPGLSPQSIFPQQATYANIPMSDLLDSEIELALQNKPIWKK